MSLTSQLQTIVRGLIGKMIPFKDIAQAEKIESSISNEMQTALQKWQAIYLDQAPWLGTNVKSLNLGAFISSEIARQVLLEAKVSITGKIDDNGDPVPNPRAEFLAEEFGRFFPSLRPQLEQGLASGGMIIKPYPKNDGHIYFDCAVDWNIYPVAFSDDGGLSDVIVPEFYQIEDKFYTRLERHALEGENVKITQKVYESSSRNYLGTPVPIDTVPAWAGTEEEATVTNAGGQMFGWFKVAAANNVDPTSPLGASVFSKAIGIIEQADRQYSRLLWEYEGSELAIHVDPIALKPTATTDANGKVYYKLPELNERLYRKLNIEKSGGEELFDTFSPAIRDASLINGLNQLLIRAEDLSGLSRGTLSDANVEPRTATELNIVRQRSYATIADNQAALEACLRNVIRAMDVYASAYGLAPEGEYDVSFEWDDSIITDMSQQVSERMMFYNAGMISKAEMRQFYFGETPAQAQAAIQNVRDEKAEDQMAQAALLPTFPDDKDNGPKDPEEGE